MKHEIVDKNPIILGKIAEAEAIEKNMRAKSGSVPPAGYPQVKTYYYQNHSKIDSLYILQDLELFVSNYFNFLLTFNVSYFL